MKTLFLFIVAAVLSITALPAAAELNDSQKALRDSISSYLQRDGFRPSVTDKGTIIFKCEGKSLEISIIDSWIYPKLVRLSLVAKLDGKDKIYYQAANEVNSKH